MKAGASVSGGLHAALIGFAIFAGDFVDPGEARPIAIAEVTLMSGTEFEAALSAAPRIDPNLPPSPAAPNEAEERADLEIAATDAAPTRPETPDDPNTPEQGDLVDAPAEAPDSNDVADIGPAPASPLAPTAERTVAQADRPNDLTPVIDRLSTPAPSARVASAPDVVNDAPAEAPAPALRDVATPRPQTSDEAPAAPAVASAAAVSPAPAAPSPFAQPDSAAAPVIEETAEPAPPAPQVKDAATPQPAAVQPAPEAPAPDAPEAPTEIAAAAPPAPIPDRAVAPEIVEAEEEPETLNDPTIPAPKLSPPPTTRRPEAAEAAKAARLAREPAKPAETGATRQAETSQGGGTSRVAGRVSFRDREALRVGIKNEFNPPRGGANEENLAVVIRIELTDAGKIVGKPKLIKPKSPNGAERALMRAGVRALVRSAAKGVFARLPKDKYASWRVIRVTFTPKEIQFL